MRLQTPNRKNGLLILASVATIAILIFVTGRGHELQVLRGQTPVEVDVGKYNTSSMYRLQADFRDLRLKIKKELGPARINDQCSSEWRSGSTRIILQEGISFTSEELSSLLSQEPRPEEEFQQWFAEQSRGWVTIEIIREPNPIIRIFNRLRNHVGV